EVRLEANDQYWGGKPRIRTIVSRPYPDVSARILALESGDVDLIFQVPPQEAARLAKNPSLVVYTPPTARVIWLYLNTQWGPFKGQARPPAALPRHRPGRDRDDRLRGDGQAAPLAGPGGELRLHRGLRPVRLHPRAGPPAPPRGRPAEPDLHGPPLARALHPE